MPRFFRPRLAPFAALLLVAAPLARASDDATRAAISKELQNPAMARGWTGVYVKSLDNSRVIFAQNADKLFIPASNNKLLVSSCCVDALPAGFHATTTVLRDGALNGGVLAGNLYLKGGGDPTLETKDLAELANALKAAGITRITGDVVADDSIFDAKRLGDSWSWDDLAADYSGEIDGLTVDRSVVNAHIVPGAAGQPPVITLLPDAGYMLVRNTATTVGDTGKQEYVIDRPLAANVITVSGTIRAGSKGETVGVSMEEPALYTAFLYRKILRDNGIAVDGSARKGLAPAAAIQVAAHDSPNLAAVLKLLNKPSDNLIAETLLKQLGAVKKGQGTDAAGIGVERAYLEKIGVPDDGWLISDGSGLSRVNLVAPESLVRVLSYMWSHPNRNAFINSLPIAGVDGSLRGRMKGTKAEGNVRAKTGYVGKARTLTGYVTNHSGETLAFSLMMNHYNGETAAINMVQDHICEILAESSK